MASKVLTRRISRDGPLIPAVGFGLVGASLAYGATDSDETRLKLLDRAWELGCTNWDTADVYGDSEDVVGKWFKLHPERRADIFLATKFGLLVKDDGVVADSSPEHCEKAVEQSLKHLGVDQIDLYYVHRADPNVPIEKTVRVMKQLVEKRKVKYLGLSEVSSATLRRAQAIHPISAVQEDSGTHLLATAKELGVSVFAYSPLARGMLTARYRSAADFDANDVRRTLERFQGDNFQKNLVLVDKFNEVARRKGCTTGQLVLAWLTAQSDNVFVIPGTKKVPYLEENFGASMVSITTEEERELRKLVEEAGVSGSRGASFGSYIDTVRLE